MRRQIAILVCTLVAAGFSVGRADDSKPLELELRYRVNRGDDRVETRIKRESWKPSQSAIIVCDVWDAHH
jgi:hypothetical protein